MHIAYDENNISLRFWAWCTWQSMEETGIRIVQTISDESVFLSLSKEKAVELNQSLTNGISMEQLIQKLDSYGLPGKNWYIYLMQKGMIE